MPTDFSFDVPERFNFGRDVVDRLAADRSRVALYFEDESGRSARYTFWDFACASSRIASLLAAHGVERGDAVLVMLPRLPQWHASIVAGLKLGALVIPCTAALRPKDVEYRAQHSGARAILTTFEGAAVVEQVRERCPALTVRVAFSGLPFGFESTAGDAASEPPAGWIDADRELARCAQTYAVADTASAEPALCYYTSGTTKDPKAVLHSHAYTWCQRFTARFWLDARPDGLHWTTSDTGWAKAAYGVLFGPWGVGAPTLMYNGRFDPVRELELLERYQVTTFCAPPTEYRMLVKHDLSRCDLSRLRHCTGAGEPLNPEVIRIWHERTGLWIHDGYGQTESILLVGNLPGMEVRPGAMGLPFPGHDVAVVDESGREAGVDEVGDIVVRNRPPSLLLEYWKNPDETAFVFRDGLYWTGDRGFRDADGYLWFVGRADDVIISAGYRIGPFEVESALLTHPAVLESAVVAKPDPDRGHVVKAFVVLRDGVTGDATLADELKTHVKNTTAPYKYPREVEFVAELPKTVSGKIRRAELRKREEQRGAAS
ncbi:MAG: acyl--CoA ligase [Thermodesulfobacteriota bacterium]